MPPKPKRIRKSCPKGHFAFKRKCWSSEEVASRKFTKSTQRLPPLYKLLPQLSPSERAQLQRLVEQKKAADNRAFQNNQIGLLLIVLAVVVVPAIAAILLMLFPPRARQNTRSQKTRVWVWWVSYLLLVVGPHLALWRFHIPTASRRHRFTKNGFVLLRWLSLLAPLLVLSYPVLKIPLIVLVVIDTVPQFGQLGP